MTFLPALEEAGASAGSEAEAGTTSAGKKFGLSGSQKASAVSTALPKPRTHHPYVVGLVLIVGGALMLVGSVTGTLPSMIAALFLPNALDDSNQTPVEAISSLKAIGSGKTKGSQAQVQQDANTLAKGGLLGTLAKGGLLG